MAVVLIGLPIFEGGLEDNIGVAVDLYRGYLHDISVDATNPGGGPTGAERGIRILRGCMKDLAAKWFDREITRKNWKIANFLKNGVANNITALRGLNVLEGAG